jgi:hypothetical protein
MCWQKNVNRFLATDQAKCLKPDVCAWTVRVYSSRTGFYTPASCVASVRILENEINLGDFGSKRNELSRECRKSVERMLESLWAGRGICMVWTTDWILQGWGFIPDKGNRSLPSPKRPDRPSVWPNFLCSPYRRIFSAVQVTKLHPSRAEGWEQWSCTSTPLYILMV